MFRHQAGRGGLGDRKGMSIVRTTLVALLAPILAWWLIYPSSVPVILKLNIPQWLVALGLVMIVVGMLLRVLAQRTLGQQWSADLSLRQNHRLVVDGEYRWFCHPIYTSYHFLGTGLFLCTGNWMIGGLALAYTFTSMLRIDDEERMLIGRFGREYLVYKHYVLERRGLVLRAGIFTVLLLIHTLGAVVELSFLFNF
jgi:protein-S-isoprenylcysteine O-methyltransferase Ste14